MRRRTVTRELKRKAKEEEEEVEEEEEEVLDVDDEEEEDEDDEDDNEQEDEPNESSNEDLKAQEERKVKKRPKQQRGLVDILSDETLPLNVLNVLRLHEVPVCSGAKASEDLAELHLEIAEWVRGVLEGVELSFSAKVVLGLADCKPKSAVYLWEQHVKEGELEEWEGEGDASFQHMFLIEALRSVEDDTILAWIWMCELTETENVGAVPWWIPEELVEEAAYHRASIGRYAKELAKAAGSLFRFKQSCVVRKCWHQEVEDVCCEEWRRTGLPLPQKCSFGIRVVTFNKDDPEQLWVDIWDRRHQRTKRAELPLHLLGKADELASWASKQLGKPHTCAKYKDSSALKEMAAEMARNSDASAHLQIRWIGRQDERTFILSDKVEFDFGEERLVQLGKGRIWDPSLLGLEGLPRGLFQERLPRNQDGGIAAWIKLWKDHYGRSHLVELFVVLGHVALCMNAGNHRPCLLIKGEAGAGKTVMMEFVSLMLGFRDGLVLPQSVTTTALSEKLHFVSGFPVFCNDPATDKELGVVREFVKSVFDGGFSKVVHNRALRANGFLIVSLNPKPLEQFFGKDADSAWASRCVILPVSRSSVKKGGKTSLTSLLSQRKQELPSSLLVLKDLLCCSAPVEDLDMEVGPSECGPRVQESLAKLEVFTNRFADIANEVLDIAGFFRKEMHSAASEHLKAPLVARKLLASEFLDILKAKFFRSGKLKEIFNGKDSVPLVWRKKGDVYFVRLQEVVQELDLDFSVKEVKKAFAVAKLVMKKEVPRYGKMHQINAVSLVIKH